MGIQFQEGKQFDVIALGRACIDLNAAEYNRPMEETRSFTKYVGGSPANIAIGSAKLGLKVGFVGKIPDDQHGRFISSYMREAGVDTSQLVIDREGHKAGLTFTEILSPEECSILMYREKAADLYLSPDEIDAGYVRSAKVLLISGTALAQSPSREAALKAVSLAKAAGTKVVFELDYRPYTWSSREETSVYYTLLAGMAHIVIGTREEYDIMKGASASGNEQTAKMLFAKEPELVVIKHGVDGSYAYLPSGETFRAGVYKTNVLKTFGAGDSYASAFLYGLLRGYDIDQALRFGSASASIVVSKHSSSEAMPTLSEIKALVEEQHV
ncbi:5-dehydro-2-deoxygluconokinase [Shouchella clausii]|uniref:5-dehydro-2-deoxygluconokinase n=1 Tax=Shouchella clausii TaxID=79880 RepID=UPI00270519A7|nr:5-dehydro-2-deoxygluconokinase [Shouchella clausii]MDO7268903.1 5-dehydro-2-deoxygluconokinase [Shouchella clausii]MDO7288882.1 5-dehydro-2-deoxygluconokinase [Shouchella clausii]